ncbi:MAG: hypothetical protein FWE91_02185 [Defluviitaleaceae bacterium]|nr:hypothetical protein [Defluviitaleaceae bacterium]MCL2835115.1 hypothetical protein [Defluviitaleaceae bacterium]
MNDTKKLLFTDSGKNHTLIKRQWVAAILSLISLGLTFYSRWNNWQIRNQFYRLWDELPSFPFFADLLVLAILIVILASAAGKAIGRSEIHIYDNGIEGYGFKFWDFRPKMHNFALRYDDIRSVKKHRWGLSIRSAEGRYNLIVRSPEICAEKINNIIKRGDYNI